jgi:poly(A) polymerase
MTHPATAAVLDALAAAGGEDAARFVGGCVRNALITAPVADIDIATTLTPPNVIKALEAAGLRAIPTGIEHGTITALAQGQTFEITTLRRDVETDGRRAVVAFTDDWAEDAARRDFRLNALYADRSGRLFDPTGGGLADAHAGRVVFVGDAKQRIREDALRILRFFRFQAWYGRGEPDAAALAACAALKDLLAGLSAERVGQEALKLLAAPDPRPAVRLMSDAGVLARVLPRTRGLARFDALVALDPGVPVGEIALPRLAALLPDDPAAGLAAAAALRLSNARRDRLAAALGTEPPLGASMNPPEVRRAVYRLGAEVFRDRALLAWAGADRPADAPLWRAILRLASDWAPPRLPVGGEDVIAAGVPAGPRVGAVLREVEAWWIANDFADDRRALFERLTDIAKASAG